MAEGLSVALPLRVDTLDGAYGLNKDLESMANQNLKMVILTNPGERIMSPSFGVGIRRLLFEPATPGTVETIKNRIQLQVKKYLPYIDLVNLRVFMSKTDATSLVVIIKYSIPAANIVKEFSLVV
tara:strand:+ start:709 stop:1083 length:375 start_codon:yes stop_codon:yes gene_type:complete